MDTTFSDAACPTPSPGGNHAGLSGGQPIMDGHGEAGLVSSPYDNGICPTPGGKETPSSELGTTPTLVDVKDAPAGEFSGSAIGMLQEHQSDQTFDKSGGR
jgi:hypothetical protein